MKTFIQLDTGVIWDCSLTEMKGTKYWIVTSERVNSENYGQYRKLIQDPSMSPLHCINYQHVLKTDLFMVRLDRSYCTIICFYSNSASLFQDIRQQNCSSEEWDRQQSELPHDVPHGDRVRVPIRGRGQRTSATQLHPHGLALYKWRCNGSIRVEY